MNPFEIMKAHYNQRDQSARQWKAKGGKVVGYLSEDVPEEMILASGFFPFRVSGDPWGGTEEADKYSEPFYNPTIRSIFNGLLTGKYDFLDYLVIPHSSDAILRLYYQLHDVQKINPLLKLPELYLFDLLHTRFWVSGLYILDRVREFKKKLEEWSEKEISKKSLIEAIVIENENKRLLEKVSTLRTAEPPRLSGTEALQIIGSSMFMPKETHNRLLRQFLDKAELHPRDGVRLFLEGSDLDHLQFYELVESFDATIVDETHSWGHRYFDDPVDTTIDPLEAIAERYHLRSPSPRMHSIDLRINYGVKQVLKAKAQGVLFFFLEWDSAPVWDYPDQKRALEEKGIPTLCFDMQKYLIPSSDEEKIRTEVERFVKKIRKIES